MACLLSLRRSIERINVLDYIAPILFTPRLLIMLRLSRNRGEPDEHLMPYPRSDGLVRVRGRTRKGVKM